MFTVQDNIIDVTSRDAYSVGLHHAAPAQHSEHVSHEPRFSTTIRNLSGVSEVLQ